MATPAQVRAGLKVNSLKMTQGAPFWTVSVLEWMGRIGLAKVDKQNPMVRHPLFGPLTALLAVFDFLRLPFSRTSQMFVTVEAAPAEG